MSRTSVVVVNYKGIENTQKCLRALHASAPVPRIAVVDNTPNEAGLADMVRSFPEATLIISPANLGFGGGNNRGIEWAIDQTDCDFVLILNNDAWIQPDTITRLEQALDADPASGLVTPKIVFAEDPGRLWYGPGFVEWRFARGNVPGFNGPVDTHLAERRGYVEFASGCVMLIRRELLVQLGGFNSNYFMYEEDTEFSIRAIKHGFKILYMPEIVVHHVVQASTRNKGEAFIDALSPANSQLTFYVLNIIRNRIFTLRLHGGLTQKIVFGFWFPIYLVRLALIYCAARRFDGVAALFRATRDGLFDPCVEPVKLSVPARSN